jgi:hypothetical protein
MVPDIPLCLPYSGTVSRKSGSVPKRRVPATVSGTLPYRAGYVLLLRTGTPADRRVGASRTTVPRDTHMMIGAPAHLRFHVHFPCPLALPCTRHGEDERMVRY